jgi:outer membrane protein OmpA-like peptidoglycan-associated protein
MNTRLIPTLSLVAAAALATLTACSTVSAPNPRLDDARDSLRQVQLNPQAQNLPGTEMRDARQALSAAEAAQAQNQDTATVDHLAYLARQRVAVVEQSAARRASENAVTLANAEREQLRLRARTQEADDAQRNAAASQRDAQTAQRSAESSQRDARTAQRDAQSAQRDAQSAQRDTVTAQRDLQTSRELAGEAERRANALQAQLRELNAKQTERGMVITIGDVLFDTNRADLKSGSARSMDKLVVFLKAYPQRHALIEGFTDSVGSEGSNQSLSARRADAVRGLLVSQGVGSDRLATRGYGEAFPVAGNDNASGRQMNRRVEIVLSDDSGVIAPR